MFKHFLKLWPIPKKSGNSPYMCVLHSRVCLSYEYYNVKRAFGYLVPLYFKWRCPKILKLGPISDIKDADLIYLSFTAELVYAVNIEMTSYLRQSDVFFFCQNAQDCKTCLL